MSTRVPIMSPGKGEELETGLSSDFEDRSPGGQGVCSRRRRVVLIGFTIGLAIGAFLVVAQSRGGAATAAIQDSWDDALDQGTAPLDMNPGLLYKSAADSWSFQRETETGEVLLRKGVRFDLEAAPPLYADGCEDSYDWGNGFTSQASAQTHLERFSNEVGDRSGVVNRSIHGPRGFTCAAYATSGWCKEPGMTGAAANFPERHCCACGGGTTVNQLSGGDVETKSLDVNSAEVCHTAKHGEECYDHIQWAMNTGITSHPEWYPGLNFASSFEEFQVHMRKTDPTSKCSVPCEPPKDASGDLVAGCPRRPYDAGRWGPSFCFAQLAGNSATKGSKCACRQGCDPSRTLLASRNDTVSFKNIKRFWNNRVCSGEVLLTSPREYFKDYGDVKQRCGRQGLVDQFELLIRDSWDTFQEKICKTAMWQCFHAPGIASVSYLHMQSFAFGGYFHGMPTSNHRIGICVKQSSREETRELAIKLSKMV